MASVRVTLFPCTTCCWGLTCSSVQSPAAPRVLAGALRVPQQMCDMLEWLSVALSAVVPGPGLRLMSRHNGAGTLLDPRRTRDYDADHVVDDYLNQPEVKVGPGLSTWTAHCTTAAAGQEGCRLLPGCLRLLIMSWCWYNPGQQAGSACCLTASGCSDGCTTWCCLH